MDGNEIQAFTSGTSEDATLFLQNEGDGNVDLVDGALYVKSDGNVGIGTTSPQFLLHVNGSAGKPGGGSWSSASDARLKDIKGHFTRGLDTIDKLNPVYYSYKKDNPVNLPSDEKYIGLIAQQVQKVIPEAVGEYEDGYLSVNNDPIIWTMLNAIKELKAENKATREELSQTKAELNDLKTKVNKLESLFSQTAMLNK
ncbi:tail fiber domain-containing protein [candidate division KSB1 bacterium]|nr:tail fiber domain-containing protein [candidate division KSB1 bacterium]